MSGTLEFMAGKALPDSPVRGMDSKAEGVIGSLGVKASRSMTGLAFQFRVYGFLKWDL